MNATQGERSTATARRRGRPARIDRDRIIDAAIELGLDELTMQALADALAVSPAALYSHVSGRDEVVALVGSRLRSQLSAFESPATDWRCWLTDFAVLVRRQFAASAATLLTASRADRTTQVDVGEPGLRLLLAAGFTPTEAAYAVWLVFRIALTAGPEREASFTSYLDETGELFQPPPTDDGFLALRQVHRDLVAADGHDTFPFDLGVVLDGIAARLDTHPHRGT